MTNEQIIRPRPGSHIWRRTDGQFTEIGRQMSGVGYFDKFPGTTDEERLNAELQQPGGFTVSHGTATTEVEKILNWTEVIDDNDPVVILGPQKPSFGEWEELNEWTGRSSSV